MSAGGCIEVRDTGVGELKVGIEEGKLWVVGVGVGGERRERERVIKSQT